MIFFVNFNSIEKEYHKIIYNQNAQFAIFFVNIKLCTIFQDLSMLSKIKG